MAHIKLTTNFPKEPILRQTPGCSGRWKDDQFVVNDFTSHACDVWTVADGTLAPEQAFCRSGRTILFTMEPPGARRYSRAFLKQFDLVVCTDPNLPHPNLCLQFTGLPWHIGLDRGAGGAHGDEGFRCALDYDAFNGMEIPKKTGLLSVICSTNSSLPGHRLRLQFLDILKKELGSDIELFGRGIRPIADKFEAIAPYKYHLALENSVVPHYWTEKLGDTFLGFAHPLYWGCPNVGEYFNPRSFTPIDLSRPDEAIAIIKRTIHGNTYEDSLEEIKQARALVCDRYNLFEVVRQACQSLPPREPRMIQLKPQWYFDLWTPRNIFGRLRRRLFPRTRATA